MPCTFEHPFLLRNQNKVAPDNIAKFNRQLLDEITNGVIFF